jgi:hypothetical protein
MHISGISETSEGRLSYPQYLIMILMSQTRLKRAYIMQAESPAITFLP